MHQKKWRLLYNTEEYEGKSPEEMMKYFMLLVVHGYYQAEYISLPGLTVEDCCFYLN